MPFLPYAQVGAEVLGGYFSSKGQGESKQDRERKKWSRKALPGLQAIMMKGISDQDIASLMPLFMRMASPMINRLASGAAARFGSGSGKVAGAITQGIGQYAMPSLARLKRLQLTDRSQNRRTAYQGTLEQTL